MATPSSQKQPSKRSSDEEREEFPLKCQSPVPNPAIYPNEMYLCRRDEYHEMINHHKAVFYSRTRYRAAEVTVGDAFESVFVRVRTWATMWGKGESLSHLSDSDKQAIIASLDEYCVQEDWDSILLNLPPAARANFGLILVETMLNQFICTKFIDSPFWFMDGKINASDSETQSDFHKRFQYVYEKLIQGQFMRTTLSFALYYHVLLFCSCFFVPSILVSYFNLLTDRQPDLLTLTKLQSFPRGCSMLNDEPCVMNNIPPTPVGRTTVKHRTALVKTYTDELMCSRLFQLLLRDPVTKYKRYQRKKDLRLLLECAAQTVIHADGGLYGNTNIVRLPDLPKFNHWSGQMIVHPFHAGFEPVEGSRVLIVTRPSYSYIDILSLNHFATVPPWRANRAEVLVAAKGRKARALWAAAAAGDDREDTVGRDKEEGDSQEDDDTEEIAEPVRDLPPLRDTFWRQ
ncbi:uncharacterized protein BO96DRAFT_480848 [Aspergillus niger CBS 101883]|uniref:uncharacterized protein n=1 Tax=Aspergillus lacticoffeatus (strain CBS 101883) TaxID=1450533 RepID=UPI000D7FDF6A|nr:uncharacterized protein BO96DRAFT_480848 [Aspergillus niger CBS 101883]PYH53945.1 hypothetical protein BO96DRAFT_480848 [Aspergillus niger CBS 101883]